MAELIDWYRARWEIEMLYDVLKNACRVEALQLGSITQLERALALFMVVAWRIARLMRLGRTCPDLDAELFFDPDEIQAAYLLRKKTPPDKPTPERRSTSGRLHRRLPRSKERWRARRQDDLARIKGCSRGGGNDTHAT